MHMFGHCARYLIYLGWKYILLNMEFAYSGCCLLWSDSRVPSKGCPERKCTNIYCKEDGNFPSEYYKSLPSLFSDVFHLHFRDPWIVAGSVNTVKLLVGPDADNTSWSQLPQARRWSEGNIPSVARIWKPKTNTLASRKFQPRKLLMMKPRQFCFLI